ncbi:MAG: FtsX-like permease family protein [Clostridiales bacterium]|nr:FtsX-like permease family protein [Clostridiales bacterium]
MKNTLMLALANIRKNKGSAISLLVFALIAATLLNLGLVMSLDYGKHFDTRAEQLRTPHVVIVQSEVLTTDEQKNYLENYPGVIEVEKQNILSGFGDHYLNGSNAECIVIFANAAGEQHMNPPQLIGESYPLDNESIYVPYLMKAGGGHDLGGRYQINFAGEELYFTIAGFTEELPFGALMNNVYRFYVSEERYAALAADFPDQHACLQSARLFEKSLGLQLELDYAKEFSFTEDNEEPSQVHSFSFAYNVIKSTRTMIPSIMSIIVIAFAVILFCISLIVIRFRILNSIEEGLTNIGALKALGYRSRQIIISIVWQFGGITIIGVLAGIILSRFFLPLIGRILEAQSALIWEPGFNWGLAALSLLFLTFSVALISFIVAGRIRKLHPLIALRKGGLTHNFRKNRIPLDQSYGPLSFLLSLKQLLNNKKQALTIGVIIALISFASIAAISVYYNIGIEQDEFISIIVGEKPDVNLILKNSGDADSLLKRLNARPEVRKAFGFENISLLADEYNLNAWIAKDFADLEGKMLHAGRYPKYENEVALNGLLAKTIGKEIGDRIVVKQSGAEREFLITGFIQKWEESGKTMVMTYDGLLTLQSDYQYRCLSVYLAKGTLAAAFIEDIKKAAGDIFISTIDINEQVDSQFGSYGATFAAVAFGMLTVTVLVVILILYLVIKAMILRRKQELGIQKAIGYTTLQLMIQTALNFTPVVILGVAIGGLCGHFGFNPLFTAIARSSGILETHMPSPTVWTIITCLALIALAYLVSMLIAWRIRKISPYTLVSE